MSEFDNTRVQHSNIARAQGPTLPITNIVFDQREHQFETVDQTDQIGCAVQRDENLMSWDAEKIALQAKNPFAEILAWPSRCVSVLLTANKAQDLAAPTGTKFVRFIGDGDYWITRNGSAQIPGAATFNADDAYAMGAVYRPEGVNWYIRGTANFSVISRSANRNVSMLCFFGE